jgi:hypothetical protein
VRPYALNHPDVRPLVLRLAGVDDFGAALRATRDDAQLAVLLPTTASAPETRPPDSCTRKEMRALVRPGWRRSGATFGARAASASCELTNSAASLPPNGSVPNSAPSSAGHGGLMKVGDVALGT